MLKDRMIIVQEVNEERGGTLSLMDIDLQCFVMVIVIATSLIQVFYSELNLDLKSERA